MGISLCGWHVLIEQSGGVVSSCAGNRARALDHYSGLSSSEYAADSPTAATDAVTPSPWTGAFDGNSAKPMVQPLWPVCYGRKSPGTPVLSRSKIRRRGEAGPLVAIGDLRRKRKRLTFLHIMSREW